MPKAVINNPKTHHGKMALFKEGGSMDKYADRGAAIKGAQKRGEKSITFNFEKSKKDVEPKGMKEGSKREEAFDFKQAKGMKCGGGVKKMARGGGVESKGKTRGKMV